MKPKINDPVTLNDQRLQRLQSLINTILERTGFVLGSSDGSLCSSVSPYTDLGPYSIYELKFGLLTNRPDDNRKKCLGMTLELPPRAEFVGIVTCHFAMKSCRLKKISFDVFGLKHKQNFIDLAQSLVEDLPRTSLEVTIKSRNPRVEYLPNFDGTTTHPH